MPRHLAAVLAFGPLGLVLACASPTLPLPPPGIPAQQMVDADHISLTSDCGGVEASAYVKIVNSSLPPGQVGDIVLATACGSWTAKSVFAHNGDTLLISQEIGADEGLVLRLPVNVP